MTEQEKMGLAQIKGILKAYVAINRITVKVAKETKANPPSLWMEGRANGQILVAYQAIEQNLVVLAEVDKILSGASNA